MRRPEAPTSSNALKSGIEGFADGMRIFPSLKEWENQIALHSLREGKTVQDLRSVTPFRQYLGVAKRAYLAGETSPFSSFPILFDKSPSIDMLVSLGNFHLIRTWTWTLAKQYPDLNLPLEQFFQDALYQITPYSARRYDPSIGNPFFNYLVNLLKKRFSEFKEKYQKDITAPLHIVGKTETAKGNSDDRRAKIASLDTPMRYVETPQTLFEFIETTRQIPQDTTHADDNDAKEKIHILSELAGLNEKQEETLIALYIYGGDTKLIAQLRHRTPRMVRMYRQTALESIQRLGYETVSDILTGTTPQRR